MEIKEAISEEEIIACYPVIIELRPHLRNENELVTKVKLQNESGYRLMYIKDEETNKVASIAGIRITHYLYTGKTLYIDDLCTLPSARGTYTNFAMQIKFLNKKIIQFCALKGKVMDEH